MTRTQVYLANTNSTDPMTLKEPPIAACLKGKELIGSMRGYIWSRTIPILPHYLVLGAGPDCFLYEFPQDDVLGKLYAYGTGSIVVDKPHNLYLQIFVNEGGIALLGIFVGLHYLSVGLFSLVWRKKAGSKRPAGHCSGAGCCRLSVCRIF